MKDRRHLLRGHSNHERWLVSYADFITLLFAFFVVMFSSARIDKEKTAQLAEAIQTAFQQMGASGGARSIAVPASDNSHHATKPTPSSMSRLAPSAAGLLEITHKRDDFAQIQKDLEKLLAPEIQRREVALRLEPDGLIISLREIGFFDSGSAQIKPQAVEAVARVSNYLRERNCALRIEGHTDNVPIHNSLFASNWELSTARATTMVKRLVENDGFAPERLSAAGFAEFHPVAENSTPTGQQLNRRVDIVVVPLAVSPRVMAAGPAATSPLNR
jgi:chemotaxis protein MotB